MSEPEDESESEDVDVDVGRPPICPYCGVTALPGDPAYVTDGRFVCDNAECDAYGDVIES